MRCAWPLLSATLLLLAIAPAPTREDAVPIAAFSVPLDPVDPGQVLVGRLRYEGGLVVSSGDARVGGLSALRILDQGKHLLAISDCGDTFFTTVRRDEGGRMVGLAATATLTPLVGGRGRPLASDERDAEGLALSPSGGLFVSFERKHRVWCYGQEHAQLASPVPVAVPRAVEDLPHNSGLEALVGLPDGRLLLLAEGSSSCPGVGRAWIGRDGAWKEATFPLHCAIDAPERPFNPTDGVALPSGDVIVVERRYPPLGARLRRIAREDLDRGNLAGAEIAMLRPPLTLDNFEGLDAWRAPDGTTRLLLLSDDNGCRKDGRVGSTSQRTLLLEFTLLD